MRWDDQLRYPGMMPLMAWMAGQPTSLLTYFPQKLGFIYKAFLRDTNGPNGE